MNRTNYSLISALVDSQGAGLYNDIYIPIIKYAIISLYSKTQSEYHMVADVYGAIKEIFGLDIPLMVIKKIISNYESINGLSLEYYNNEHFKIIEPWDVSSNDLPKSSFCEWIRKYEQFGIIGLQRAGKRLREDISSQTSSIASSAQEQIKDLKTENLRLRIEIERLKKTILSARERMGEWNMFH